MYDLTELQEQLRRRRPVPWDQLPDFSLYMDQVLSYMDRQVIRFDGDDGLTAAMVNNYTKSGLVPRAEGKKYSRDHLAYLTAICVLKRVMSTKDMDLLIREELQGDRPVSDGYAAFCASLDKALTAAADEMAERTGEEELADAAIHFALMSYAAGVASSRYVTLLRQRKEAREAAEAAAPAQRQRPGKKGEGEGLTMRDFVIVTDSCCDMTAEMAQELELEVLPLSLTMGDQVYHNYLDGREIGFRDFYAKLRAGALATTSAISVGAFEEAMGRILDSGRDVLYLAFSSALSTTYQSAVIAAEDLKESHPDGKVLVVDSLCASLGQGLLVYLCAMEKRKGKTLEEVHAFAEADQGEGLPLVHGGRSEPPEAGRPDQRRHGAGGHHAVHQAGAPCGRHRPPGVGGQGKRPEGVSAGPGGPHGKDRRPPGGADGLHQPRGLRGGRRVRGGRGAPPLRRQGHPYQLRGPGDREPLRPRHPGPVLPGRPPVRLSKKRRAAFSRGPVWRRELDFPQKSRSFRHERGPFRRARRRRRRIRMASYGRRTPYRRDFSKNQMFRPGGEMR